MRQALLAYWRRQLSMGGRPNTVFITNQTKRAKIAGLPIYNAKTDLRMRGGQVPSCIAPSSHTGRSGLLLLTQWPRSTRAYAQPLGRAHLTVEPAGHRRAPMP